MGRLDTYLICSIASRTPLVWSSGVLATCSIVSLIRVSKASDMAHLRPKNLSGNFIVKDRVCEGTANIHSELPRGFDRPRWIHTSRTLQKIEKDQMLSEYLHIWQILNYHKLLKLSESHKQSPRDLV